MTPQDRIDALRFALASIEQKIGSSESGPLGIALVDSQRAAEHWQALTIEVARRYERAVRR